MQEILFLKQHLPTLRIICLSRSGNINKPTNSSTMKLSYKKHSLIKSFWLSSSNPYSWQHLATKWQRGIWRVWRGFTKKYVNISLKWANLKCPMRFSSWRRDSSLRSTRKRLLLTRRLSTCASSKIAASQRRNNYSLVW